MTKTTKYGGVRVGNVAVVSDISGSHCIPLEEEGEIEFSQPTKRLRYFSMRNYKDTVEKRMRV